MPDFNEDDQASSVATPEPVQRRRTPPEPHVVRRQAPAWLAPVALVVAVIAVGLSIWAVTSKPAATSSGGGGSTNAGLSGDPKTRVCDAFGVVSVAVPLQTNNNLGNDQIAQAAVAGNARLALFGGGQYLLNQLDSSTPADLADPVRSFATSLQAIGMNALAGKTNTDSAQAARLVDADNSRKQVAQLCQ
ncbi:MAG: hypothetical protein ABWY93_03845 [Mycobacterium sp.]